MKIFLTGSTGFIGSHLVQKLVDDHEVTCLISSTAIGTRKLPKDAQIEFSDLTNYDTIKNLILKHKPDVIIHLAAVTPVRYSFEFPDIYQEVNNLGTINLIHSARKLERFEKFIFASTMETYGWQKEKKPFTENVLQNPASPYAVSKLAAESYIKMTGRAFNFPYIILRPCNTYGRKDETGFIVEYTITQMLKNKSPQIGTPDAVRDLMYIDDHVNAYLKALDFDVGTEDEIKQNLKTDMNYYVFNIGLSTEFEIIDVIEKIKNIIGFDGEILFGFPKNYPWRPVVEPYLSLNAEKAKKILGWRPEITLDEGLKKTVDYWKDRLG